MDNLTLAIILGVWVLNFAISWWNARTVGLDWVETKYIGGWQRFMAWMGAIMSASGFTWCLLGALLFGSYHAQFSFLMPNDPPVLSDRVVNGGFALGYLIIIPGVLFSGAMIWVDSLIQAWRRRDLPSMGLAAWNTFAQMHNTYQAFTGIGSAVREVAGVFGDLFKSGDNDNANGNQALAAIVIVLGLVALSLAGGVALTWGIVRHYAGRRELPAYSAPEPELVHQRGLA